MKAGTETFILGMAAPKTHITAQDKLRIVVRERGGGEREGEGVRERRREEEERREGGRRERV